MFASTLDLFDVHIPWISQAKRSHCAFSNPSDRLQSVQSKLEDRPACKGSSEHAHAACYGGFTACARVKALLDAMVRRKETLGAEEVGKADKA